MTTWIQDYPALPGAAEAAARGARAVAEQHLPPRADDAYELVAEMFAVGLTRSTSSSKMTLVTELHDAVPGRLRVRFELRYANDEAGTVDPPTSHQAVSALSNASGERDLRDGKMLYAELWERAA